MHVNYIEKKKIKVDNEQKEGEKRIDFGILCIYDRYESCE
jgi:hypothetical protein